MTPVVFSLCVCRGHKTSMDDKKTTNNNHLQLCLQSSVENNSKVITLKVKVGNDNGTDPIVKSYFYQNTQFNHELRSLNDDDVFDIEMINYGILFIWNKS